MNLNVKNDALYSLVTCKTKIYTQTHNGASECNFVLLTMGTRRRTTIIIIGVTLATNISRVTDTTVSIDSINAPA